MADRRRQAGYVDYDLLTPLEHELYKVVLSVKISGCAQKAGTLDKDVKDSQGGPRSRDQPDAPGGQGRGGVKRLNLHSRLHSFTIFKFKCHYSNYLRADLRDSKSRDLHWS